MNPIRTAAASIGLCLVYATSGLAEEGRIPIFESTTISAPGSYVVTRDIVGPAFLFAITVVASAQSADIDLNGFTVTGIHASGLVSLKVHNGRMQEPGIYIDGSRHLIVDRVTFNDAGIISWNLESFSITRNLFPSTGNISVDSTLGLASRPRGVIEDNVMASGIISVQSQSGPTQRGDGVLVRNNQISGGAFWAIFMGNQDGCEVSGNRVTGVGATGIAIQASKDCAISNNRVTGSGLTGIEIVASNGNLIENNISNRNGQSGDPGSGSGIYVRDNYNLIRGNVTNENALAGLHIDGCCNVYTGNMARGNLANPAGAACANPAPTCAAPYGTGSSAPDLCNDGGASSLCDNMMPGPPPS